MRKKKEESALKQYDMMFCGHICLDLVPRFPQSGPRKLSQVFIPGKLVEVGAVDVTLGGSVSNSGAAAARRAPSSRRPASLKI